MTIDPIVFSSTVAGANTSLSSIFSSLLIIAPLLLVLGGFYFIWDKVKNVFSLSNNLGPVRYIKNGQKFHSDFTPEEISKIECQPTLRVEKHWDRVTVNGEDHFSFVPSEWTPELGNRIEGFSKPKATMMNDDMNYFSVSKGRWK